jgi:hypothetical protein
VPGCGKRFPGIGVGPFLLKACTGFKLTIIDVNIIEKIRAPIITCDFLMF